MKKTSKKSSVEGVRRDIIMLSRSIKLLDVMKEVPARGGYRQGQLRAGDSGLIAKT